MIRLCANLSWLFQEHDFLARFGAARRAGFRHVECLFPYDTPAAEVKRALGEAGLALELINTPPGDWPKGERGFGAVPDAEARFRDGLDAAIDYARAVGCPRLHLMAGLQPAGVALAECEAVFVDNLRAVAAALARHALIATIEPLNSTDVPGYVLSGSGQAARLIETVGRPNLKLQWDAYHLQIMEGNLAAGFERLGGMIGHVQIAGVPGRHEPDVGEINYAYLLARIDALGYGGMIGCEYRPRAGTLDGLGWARPYGIGAAA